MIMLVLIICIFSSMIWGYSTGANAECPYGFNSCIGQLGGMIGMIIILIVWVVILFFGIILFEKTDDAVHAVGETGGKDE